MYFHVTAIHYPVSQMEIISQHQMGAAHNSTLEKTLQLPLHYLYMQKLQQRLTVLTNTLLILQYIQPQK